MGCGSSISNRGDVRTPPRSDAPNQTRTESEQNGRRANQTSQPLQLPSRPWKEAEDLSREELKRRREEFWHTRVSGNPQAWSVLKMAAEAILNDEVETANAIVEAGGLMTPNGTLSICYDDHGGSYEVPRFVYSDPMNLLETVENDKIMKEIKGEKRGDDPEDLVPLSLNFRVAPGEKLYNVTLQKGSSVEELKDFIAAEVSEQSNGELTLPKDRMRLIWWGRELTAGQNLKDCGVLEGQMIQVYLRKERPAA